MEYIFLSVSILIVLFLIYFRFRPKLSWPKSTATTTTSTTSTTPVPVASPITTSAKPFDWSWLKWLKWPFIVIGILAALLIIGSWDLAQEKIRLQHKVNNYEKQPNFLPNSRISTDFTPNHIGEWKIGKLLPGEYVYTVDGQYLKTFRYDDGPIVGAEGVAIRDAEIICKLPFPEKNFGQIFIRVGNQYVFPGERFCIEKETDVFAEANIARGTGQNNYKNRGAVRITVEPAPPIS